MSKSSVPQIRAEIETALAALSGTWRSSSHGRIRLITGSKAAREQLISDLVNNPPPQVEIGVLTATALFPSLAAFINSPAHPGIKAVGIVAGSLDALAAEGARVGRQVLLICDGVERAPIRPLGFLCRAVNATVIHVEPGQPGILLLLLGSGYGAATRRLTEAWPDAEMGVIGHELA